MYTSNKRVGCLALCEHYEIYRELLDEASRLVLIFVLCTP